MTESDRLHLSDLTARATSNDPGVWPEFDLTSLLTGEATLDREHAELIGILRQLWQMARRPEHHTEFFDLFSKLGGRLFNHFENEEKIIASFGFPESLLRLHAISRDEIIQQYVQINIELMQGVIPNPEVVPFVIRDWILDHLKNDMTLWHARQV